MKFKDPLSITCRQCGARSDQRVARLLALEAVCPRCNSSLITDGLDMRQGVDDWSNFMLAYSLAFHLERQMGGKFEFEEEELSPVKTLHDLSIVVEHHLPPGGTATSQAMSLVKSAAEQIRRELSIANKTCCEDALDFDVPLIDAIHPHRWNIRRISRTYSTAEIP